MTQEGRKESGQEGEALAAQFLKKQGYQIIEQNFRCRYGEIDLIAWDQGTLVFIEVKMRASSAFGGPEGAVNLRKQEKISRVALAYLDKKNPPWPLCRFDVVGIIKTTRETTITLFQDAFEMTLPTHV